jgi:radical SAM superfamily enzyme YgiQ (UPF0313 family)
MTILMLYPRFPYETFWNTSRSGKVFLRRPGIMPPLGLLTIASYLPQDFDVRLIDRNVSEETEADWAWADVVFLSLMLVQQQDYAVCVENAKTHEKPIAVGGPITHALPEAITADADWVCFGEGESIMDALIGDLRAGCRGKQYQGGNQTRMDTVKLPRFDLIHDVNAYSSMPIQFSRGCPFQCEFCDIIEIYGRVPRTKTPDQILAELSAVKELGFRGNLALVDDNFIGNKKKATAMLTAMATWNRDNGYPFRYFTEASINLADDKELLQAMSRADLVYVFIGIETPDPKLLKTTLKMQNIPGDPLAKLRKIREHGIHITGGFIVGFDGEDRDVFEAQKRFIQESGIGVAILGLLQALPHTQLSRRLKREGRLLESANPQMNTTVDGINFIPKGDLTKREYLEGYARLVKELYEPKMFFDRILPALLTLQNRQSSYGRYRALWEQLPAMLRFLYRLGVRTKDARFYFWKTFISLLWKNPGSLEALGWDCFHFYYLKEHVVYVEGVLSQYLSEPAADDKLDEVLSPFEVAQPIAVNS